MTRDDLRAMLARFDEQAAATRRFFEQQAADNQRFFAELDAKSQRRFDAAAEELSGDIQLIAEGQGALIEEIDSLGTRLDRRPNPDA